jgi:O-antigen/teichoic acid export membrane protein
MAAGAAIGIVGILLLTRKIGPANYGAFAAGHAILSYLVTLTECGLGTYLIRHEKGDVAAFDQAFVLLLLLGLVGIFIGLAAVPVVNYIYRSHDVGIALMVLVMGLPLVHAVKVPMARLEQQLDYRRVALIELTGNIGYYAVALPLAYKGAGVGAPLAGWWAQQLTQFVQAYSTGYRPRLVWRKPLIREMFSFGISFVTSQWILAARDLVNPIIVGRIAGATGVGFIALAMRIVLQLGFIREATTRISVAAFARLRGYPDRFSRAISEGAFLQVLAIGSLLVLFTLVGPVAIPMLFGPKWLPILDVYPWLAVAAIAASMFRLQSSTLTVLGQNRRQAIAEAVRLAGLFIGAALLIPKLGLAGYGIAELASLPLFGLLLHRFVAANGIRVNYSGAMLWFVAFAVPILFVGQTWLALLALVLPFLWPPARQQLWRIVQLFISEPA